MREIWPDRVDDVRVDADESGVTLFFEGDVVRSCELYLNDDESDFKLLLDFASARKLIVDLKKVT